MEEDKVKKRLARLKALNKLGIYTEQDYLKAKDKLGPLDIGMFTTPIPSSTAM